MYYRSCCTETWPFFLKKTTTLFYKQVYVLHQSGFSTYTSLVVAPCLKFKYISYFFLKSNYVVYIFFDRRHFLNCTYIRIEIWVIEKVIHIFKNWSIKVNTLFPCITKVRTNKQMDKRKLHSRCVLQILHFLVPWNTMRSLPSITLNFRRLI